MSETTTDDFCWASNRPATPRCGEPTRADTHHGVWCQCERGEPGVDDRVTT